MGTIVSGVLVFVLGQIFIEFFLRPVKELKYTVGKIDNDLKFFENVLVGVFRPVSGIPESEIAAARRVMRKLSCDLESGYRQIFFRQAIGKIMFNISDERKVSDAATRLIRLSNAGGDADVCRNNGDVEKIRENLNIRKLES